MNSTPRGASASRGYGVLVSRVDHAGISVISAVARMLDAAAVFNQRASGRTQRLVQASETCDTGTVRWLSSQ